jgi:hypothetical protein
MEHKTGDEAYVILHRGARSRGYKRRGRERERERVWPRGELSKLASSAFLPLCLPLLSCVRLCLRASACFSFSLDIPFYRHKEMAQLYNGGVAMR